MMIWKMIFLYKWEYCQVPCQSSGVYIPSNAKKKLPPSAPPVGRPLKMLGNATFTNVGWASSRKACCKPQENSIQFDGFVYLPTNLPFKNQQFSGGSKDHQINALSQTIIMFVVFFKQSTIPGNYSFNGL